MATREVSLDNKVDMQCMHVNVPRNIAKMTKKVVTYELTKLVGSALKHLVCDLAAVDERDSKTRWKVVLI